MKRKKIIKILFIYLFIFTLSGLNLFYYSIFTAFGKSATPPFFAGLPARLRRQAQAGELLVKFKNRPEIQRIKIDQDLDILKIIADLKDFSEIEYLEPNYKFFAAAFPNDPLYFEQWYLRTINAQPAWSRELLTREQEKIAKKSIIAVLDTGITLDHPDLKSKIWINKDEIAKDGIDNDKNGYIDDVNGWDFISEDNDPAPSFDTGYNKEAVNHGTIVAGIAAAAGHNQEGISGVSWSSQIMPLRVLDSQGIGDVYQVVRAIDYAVEAGAEVINMSFVGTGYNPSLAETIRQAYERGVLIVAAAGNTDPALNGFDLDIYKSYPVCYNGSAEQNMVIGVASIGKGLKKSTFSNYGECIDLTAPGENFYSTQVYYPTYSGFEKYYNGYWSGTSLSAPLVSGTLALIKSLRPNLSAKEIRDFVLKSSKNIDLYNPEYKGKLGFGQLDVNKSLEAALGQKPSSVKSGQDTYFVAGLGLGSFPQIKVLKKDGTVFKAFYAYNPKFSGAINLAVGDINNDGKEEIVTGAGEGGGPHLRIFNIEGQVLSQFFAYNKDSRGGVNIALGDVNGDGIKEIITGSGRGVKPEVKVFDYQGNLLAKFLAYDESFLGGVKVAAGDIEGDGKDEIATGAGAGGGPQIRVFNLNGNLISQFFAYNKNFKGGVNIAVGDVHGDGRAEVIVSMEKDSMPIVKIFSYWGTMLNSFFAYNPNFLKGIYLTVGDVDNDGINEVITGAGIGGGPHLRTFDREGKLKFELFAHHSDYRGGVRPAILKY